MSDPTHPNEEPQWRDGINRENFAIRRQLRDLTKDERGLQEKLRASEASQRDAMKTIESHSRAEHWGREPERPWAWRTDAPDPSEGRNGPDAATADGNPGVPGGRLRRGWKRISGR